MIKESNKIKIKQQDKTKVLTYEWYSHLFFYGSLIIGLMTLGITIIFYRLFIFIYHITLTADEPILAKLQLALIFLAIPIVCIVNLKKCLYTYFNKTIITTTEKTIAVQHSPLPVWRGNKGVAIDRISNFHIEEKRNWGGRKIGYNLFVTLRDGSRIKLLSNHRIKLEQIQEIKTQLEESI